MKNKDKIRCKVIFGKVISESEWLEYLKTEEEYFGVESIANDIANASMDAKDERDGMIYREQNHAHG